MRCFVGSVVRLVRGKCNRRPATDARALNATTRQKPAKVAVLRRRALVPFALKVATDILDPADDIEATAIQAMRHLSDCYKALGDSSPSFSAKLKENSTKFALLYCALEATDPTGVRWRVRRKLHMFLELCSEGSMPARFWNYRDEDFGGSVSKLSRRRGGVLSLKAFSSNLLERFKIAQPAIRMLL